jgi:hypothetical protein
MRTPVAYVAHTPNIAGRRLTAALEGAGAEVYAFSSVSDLALAASAAPPDVVVGDDEALEAVGAPVVLVPSGGADPGVAVEAVKNPLVRTLAGAARRRAL